MSTAMVPAVSGQPDERRAAIWGRGTLRSDPARVKSSVLGPFRPVAADCLRKAVSTSRLIFVNGARKLLKLGLWAGQEKP